MTDQEVRTYLRGDCVVFRKTSEPFGGLSNMAPGFPVRVGDTVVATTEALYQACRFPHRPELQQLIIEQHSPMTAKMRSKPYRRDSRPDWDEVRVPIMRWCLRLKLLQNRSTFGALLRSTGSRPIVEESARDAYWGARSSSDDSELVGCNILGRLLMELRKQAISEPLPLSPPAIPDFTLLAIPIVTIASATPAVEAPLTLFDAGRHSAA